MRKLSAFKFALPAAAMLSLVACIPTPDSNVQYPDEPEIVYSERPDTAPPLRNNADLRRIMLDTQNGARREMGSPPLVWDDALAADAKAYARKLARDGKFEHDRQEGVSVRQGENLWTGTKNAFSYAELSGAWIDEKRYFKRGPFPNSSTSGQWSDVGHYTQIIWSTTTRMGCAIASNRQNDYLVCRYSPAGNIYGRNPLAGS